MKLLRTSLISLLLFAPAVFAEVGSGEMQVSIGYTGAPTDHGGKDCSTCHNSFAPNSDGSGSVSIQVNPYNPSTVQEIKVFVNHPHAVKWGFQLTAREVSDLTKNAGSFTVSGPHTQVRVDDGTQAGAPAPANASGVIEFAEHLNAPQTSSGAGYEFDLLWMPPNPEVGKVIFYISAVAANGDGSPLGDHVYTITKTVDFTGGCTATKAPLVRTVVNGASFEQNFSSNAMITVYGSGFTQAGPRIAALGDFENGSFPTVLSCVAVEMMGPGQEQYTRLPITYVDQGQINAQAPRFMGIGPVLLRAIINPDRGDAFTSAISTFNTLQTFSPAFFLLANTNSIAARFPDGRLVADPAVVKNGTKAKPGDIIMLYGTGFGDTQHPLLAGQVDSGINSITNQLVITMAGLVLGSHNVLYAGLAPQTISGLYQFNLRIPTNVPSGDIEVVITIGGRRTQMGTTIPIQ